MLRSAEVMLNTSAGGGKAPFTLVEFCPARAVVVAAGVVVIVLVTVAERVAFCPRLLLAVGAMMAESEVTVEMGSVVETIVIALTSSAGSLVASVILASCTPVSGGRFRTAFDEPTSSPCKKLGKPGANNWRAPNKRMTPIIMTIRVNRGVRSASERRPTTCAESATRAVASSI